jgi:Tfp pilus tip-associated adhesin PilY1
MTCPPRFLALLLVAAIGLLPTLAAAQEPLPAVLPEVLFLVEDSARMGQNWDGDGTLTAPDARWTYVRDAIIQVVNNAPVGMNFGVALTSDGSASEGTFGFEPLAYPGIGAAGIATALNAHTTSSNGSRTYAESYANLIDNYFERSYQEPRSWLTGPFRYSCSQAVVIFIGSDVGEADSNPQYTTTPSSNDVQCNDSVGFQGCFLDDTTNYAYSTFAAPNAGTGALTTHAILLDANSPSINSDAANLLQGAANQGQGLYYEAAVPGAIASYIWSALNETFSGEYSNAGVSITEDGSTIFASYFEVTGGHPLYKGHLLAWNVDVDPDSTTFGQILATTNPAGEAWDGGQILASRRAIAGEDNSLATPTTDTIQRVGYTARTGQLMMQSLLPFDASSLSAGSDLTTLLVDEVPASANVPCNPLAHDFDFDCDADSDDAQLLVDFIRGVPSATFLTTGNPRGTWKMGDSGRALAVAASATVNAIATEAHFVAYRTKLAGIRGMVYITSNSGMVHAFGLDADTSQGREFWFYVPRFKANWDPGNNAEFDGQQIDDLMRSGQTSVNDGHLEIEHVFLDGYSNGLTDCDAPGYSSSLKDGTIDADGCEWHRVLVWAGGYGARHHYALDITLPTSPRFLWERADTSESADADDGDGQGRAVGQPGVAPFWDASVNPASRRWIVVYGAGSQPPGVAATSPANEYAEASFYIHDMDADTSESPTDYPIGGYAQDNPTLSNLDSDSAKEYLPPEEGLFGSPTLADIDGDGGVDVGYIGDSTGYVFKILFDPNDPGAPQRCAFATPASGDDAAHVYYKPAVFFGGGGDLLVYYGSGSPFNIYSTDNGGLYVRADPEPFGCVASTVAPCAADSSLFTADGFYAFSGGTGEKLVGNPIARFGRLFFATHIPGDDPCVLGSSRLYAMNVTTCGGGFFDVATDSYDVEQSLYTEVDGLISQPVFANDRLYALNVDGSGIDEGDMIGVEVTPSAMPKWIYGSWRHVF